MYVVECPKCHSQISTGKAEPEYVEPGIRARHTEHCPVCKQDFSGVPLHVDYSEHVAH